MQQIQSTNDVTVAEARLSNVDQIPFLPHPRRLPFITMRPVLCLLLLCRILPFLVARGAHSPNTLVVPVVERILAALHRQNPPNLAVGRWWMTALQKELLAVNTPRGVVVLE